MKRLIDLGAQLATWAIVLVLIYLFYRLWLIAPDIYRYGIHCGVSCT